MTADPIPIHPTLSTTSLRDMRRIGRRELEARVLLLCDALDNARACEILPHWTCGSCRAFNGAVKEALSLCRCCGAPRP